MLDNEWGMTQYPFVPGYEKMIRVRAYHYPHHFIDDIYFAMAL